ncbi:MAG: YebC/PmpR family DNA-binding transcriptional regulator [Spirochaetales bacterium]|nr:YebC/PmpR family DNA-binding transcriptional regulator [Spirochaetales bacterium]
MSGHSKWASIKHKKGAADAKRGKIFTKIIREITVAAKLGGGDVEGNPRLRTAVLKARSENMPKDNIDRAIKKGIGGLEGTDYVELVYEAYGHGGVALMIDALTDNKNRTAADVRSVLTKSGGNLGESGCVGYLFNRKGIIVFSAEKYSEDEIFEAALEAGAEDVASHGDVFEVLTLPDDFATVLESLQNAGFEQISAEVTKIADTTIALDTEQTHKILRLIERLEDLDDIQSVSTNLEIADDYVPED